MIKQWLVILVRSSAYYAILDYDNLESHNHDTQGVRVPRQNLFIGRSNELRALHQEFDRPRPSLIVVLGRRRAGKSSILTKAAEGRTSVYYQATKATTSSNIGFVKDAMAQVLGDDPLLASLTDWQGLLAYCERAAAGSFPGLVVMLDEFPYLCEADAALPSIFQAFWDRVRANGTPLNLLLCGSKISFMEGLLAERNPLHGRQTLRLDVDPLPYRDAAQFFPNWSADDCLLTYGVFGGIPYYLDLCDPDLTLADNVRQLVLAKGAPLADEPDNLLQAEFRDVARYASLLRAVADGCTDSGQIIGRVKEFANASNLASYVSKLEGLRLIRIVRSLDATERERDRRYYLDDPFLAFWYRFCLPNRSALAAGHGEDVWKHRIAPKLSDYMGDLFEWICRDHARLHAQEVLSSPVQAVGQIWAADYDIDVAGELLDGSMLFGECKWWKDPVGEGVLDRLLECSEKTSYGRGNLRRSYILYSRNGFTADVKTRASANPDIHMFTPIELLAR